MKTYHSSLACLLLILISGCFDGVVSENSATTAQLSTCEPCVSDLDEAYLFDDFIWIEGGKLSFFSHWYRNPYRESRPNRSLLFAWNIEEGNELPAFQLSPDVVQDWTSYHEQKPHFQTSIPFDFLWSAVEEEGFEVAPGDYWTGTIHFRVSSVEKRSCPIELGGDVKERDFYRVSGVLSVELSLPDTEFVHKAEYELSGQNSYSWNSGDVTHYGYFDDCE